MSSPYWQCPQCRKLTRKDDQYYQLAELGGMGMLMSGMGKCPNCGASVSLENVYQKAIYDVAVADVYSGKYGFQLTENLRRLYEAGKFIPTEEGKRYLLSSGKSPTNIVHASAQKTTLFVFFVRTGSGPEVVSMSSNESWIEKARQAAKAPDAEVILIEQAEWNAPKLDSFDDSYLKSHFPAIVAGIQQSLVSRGIPPIAPQKLVEDIEVMGNPLTRLLVLVVKHTGDISPVGPGEAKETSKKQWWQFWKR